MSIRYTDVVRQIVHAKWGIENNGIKDLEDNWHMGHDFHHHPNDTPTSVNSITVKLLSVPLAENF